MKLDYVKYDTHEVTLLKESKRALRRNKHKKLIEIAQSKCFMEVREKLKNDFLRDIMFNQFIADKFVQGYFGSDSVLWQSQYCRFFKITNCEEFDFVSHSLQNRNGFFDHLFVERHTKWDISDELLLKTTETFVEKCNIVGIEKLLKLHKDRVNSKELTINLLNREHRRCNMAARRIIAGEFN